MKPSKELTLDQAVNEFKAYVLVYDGLDELEFKEVIERLIAKERLEAEDAVITKAHTPCECGKDHFGAPVRSVMGNVTTYCQFSRVQLTDIKEGKE